MYTLTNFLETKGKIYGVRVHDGEGEYDVCLNNINGLQEDNSELLNLGQVGTFVNKREGVLVSGREFLEGNLIPSLDKGINFKDCSLARPQTYIEKSEDLIRDVESDILDWYCNYQDKVLYVEGPRQVGKTYTIMKMIDKIWGLGSEGVYVLNLMSDEVREALVKYRNRPFKKAERTSRVVSTVEKFAQFFFEDFSIDTAKVLYVDEIQEDSGLYNTIREFAREKKCRLIVSGSYLNLVSNAMLGKNTLKPPTGGDYRISMKSLSFMEFLRANGIINIQVLYKNSDDYTDEDIVLFEKVQKLYHVYLRIGGYPEVVREYISSGDIEDCSGILEELILGYFEESKPYLARCLPMVEFESTFISLFEIMTNVNTRFKLKDIAVEIKEYFKRNKKSISTPDVCSTLSWLSSGGFLASIRKYRSLDNLTDYATDQRYYFCDLGVANYVASLSRVPESEINGYLAENFVYLQLAEAYPRYASIMGYVDIVKDAVIGNAELDFLYKDTNKGGFVGVEVKYSNTGARSLSKIRKSGKLPVSIKVVDAKTDISTGSVPIFLLRYCCLLGNYKCLL